MLAAHFAHAASDHACTAARETMLHRLAKQLIADGAPLALPEVAAGHAGRRRVVRPAATVRAEAAALEPGLDGLRPDVVAVVGGRPLLVEVAVTHLCGPEKAALIRERRLAAVEIDLSWLARDAPLEALERAVLRSAPRRWLWNRHAEAAEAAMRAEAARLAARRARGREAALERVARELVAAMAVPPPRAPAGPVDTVRAAGLGGTVGTAVAGDGCFAVAREVWQARLVLRHVLGGIPLDPRGRGGAAPAGAAAGLRGTEAGRLRLARARRPLPGAPALLRGGGRLRPHARRHGPAAARRRRPVAVHRGSGSDPRAG